MNRTLTCPAGLQYQDGEYTIYIAFTIQGNHAASWMRRSAGQRRFSGWRGTWGRRDGVYPAFVVHIGRYVCVIPDFACWPRTLLMSQRQICDGDDWVIVQIEDPLQPPDFWRLD